MSGPAYRVATSVAGRIHEHLRQHRDAVTGPADLALVASQDGRFTVFAWSPSTGHVYAHRVDALLM